jgi:putative ABC transport system ATP-binding protein
VLDCAQLVKRFATATGGFELRVERLSIRAGELVMVTSASGSGKTTLLDLVAMILRPCSVGRLHLMDSSGASFDVAAFWQSGALSRMDRLRGELIGYVLQGGGLLPFLSVRRNIELTARLRGSAGYRQIAEDLAERLGIAPQLDKPPDALSVGERQRAAIARALAQAPRLLLADEPTAALDAINGAEVMALFRQQAAVAGTAVLMASHSHGEPLPECGRVLSHRLEQRGRWVKSVFSD